MSQPRSCLDLLKDGVKISGFYMIFTADNRRLAVHCDFSSESGAAWTLVMSHSKKNKNLKQFKQSLRFNLPVNDGSPNWNAYRMSLPMMKNLQAFSTHWRYTCNHPQNEIDYDDYARAKFSSLNPLTFESPKGSCAVMEYINVRGHACGGCKAYWLQYRSKDKRILHFDSYKNRCEFHAKKGAVKWEDNFGFYRLTNSKFRCTASASSTTNLWFGEFL